MSVSTPIGFLEICAVNEALVSALFKEKAEPDDGDAFLHDVSRRLHAYFSGSVLVTDIPMAPKGTDFQLKVWNELQNIEYGQTASYLELAEKCGGKTYTRAVASANARNPISLFIPCHRVIGSDGSLTGYAGGLERKKYLLELEGAVDQLSLF